MRLFLLPISTRQALIYCQRAARNPAQELSYVDKITKKAADTWAKWEAAEKGWQKKLTVYGNRGLQRIPYQEWGLKSFPPLSPKVQAEELAENQKFSVFFPENIINSEDVPKVLSRLASERKDLHWKRFWGCMVGLPFTVPFGLIPVLPNIPFFYLAFRCWSHWRALKGSDHLDFLLDHRLLRPVSSSEMEQIYLKTAPDLQNSFAFVTRTQVLEGSDPEEQLLLKSGSHKVVAQILNVAELGGEVERAIHQVEASLAQQKALEKERLELEAHRKAQEQERKP